MVVVSLFKYYKMNIYSVSAKGPDTMPSSFAGDFLKVSKGLNPKDLAAELSVLNT